MALTTGLQAYWTFNEGSGTSVSDATGNGITGTWSGTLGSQWTNGIIGDAGSFNGSDNFVDDGNPASISNTGSADFSVFFWIKTSSTGTRKSIFSAGLGGTNPNKGLFLYINTSNNLAFDLNGVAGPTGGNVTNGAWRLVGVTNTSGTIQLYIDGTSSGNSASMSPNITSSAVRTGKSLIGDASAFLFSGLIDEGGYWNRALTASEIAQLYNRGNGLEYPLTNYTTLYYRQQNKIENLSRKNGNSSYRLSDQQQILYGGRGVNKGSDELVYLNGKNADAATVNRHASDAWVKFAEANGAGNSNRADQVEREFYQQGNFT